MDRLNASWIVALTVATLTLAGCGSRTVGDYHEVTEAPATETQGADAANSVSVATTTALKPSEGDPLAPVEAGAPDSSSATGSPTVSAKAPAEAPTVTATGDAARPSGVRLLIPEREFAPVGQDQALRLTFDDLDLLKILNMEFVPADAPRFFPAWLQALDGQKVQLRGWMFPPPEQEGLGGFLFVRDNQICCFGRDAKVYDQVGVVLKDGETVDYIQGRPFDVIGTLAIQPEVEDDKLLFLYFIKDAVVVDG